MKIIKSVLEEKLKNSLRMKMEFEKALAVLPRGVLVRKFVKGHQYYYLMMRKGSKVRFEYKGKLFGKEIAHFDEVKKDRVKYRRLLEDVKKQIAFLRRTLSCRELRAVS
jgi:ribosomal protein S3